MLYNKAREQVALDKLWLLDNTILTHPANTQADADRMSDIISKKNEALQNEIMLTSYQITEQQLLDKYAVEDGFMKIVD